MNKLGNSKTRPKRRCRSVQARKIRCNLFPKSSSNNNVPTQFETIPTNLETWVSSGEVDQPDSDDSAESILIEKRAKQLLDIGHSVGRRNIFKGNDEIPKIRPSIIGRTLRNKVVPISSTPMSRQRDNITSSDSSLNISPIKLVTDENTQRNQQGQGEPKTTEQEIVVVDSSSDDEFEETKSSNNPKEKKTLADNSQQKNINNGQTEERPLSDGEKNKSKSKIGLSQSQSRDQNFSSTRKQMSPGRNKNDKSASTRRDERSNTDFEKSKKSTPNRRDHEFSRSNETVPRKSLPLTPIEETEDKSDVEKTLTPAKSTHDQNVASVNNTAVRSSIKRNLRQGTHRNLRVHLERQVHVYTGTQSPKQPTSRRLCYQQETEENQMPDEMKHGKSAEEKVSKIPVLRSRSKSREKLREPSPLALLLTDLPIDGASSNVKEKPPKPAPRRKRLKKNTAVDNYDSDYDARSNENLKENAVVSSKLAEDVGIFPIEAAVNRISITTERSIRGKCSSTYPGNRSLKINKELSRGSDSSSDENEIEGNDANSPRIHHRKIIPRRTSATSERNLPINGQLDTDTGNRKLSTILERLIPRDGGPSTRNLSKSDAVPGKLMEDVGTSPINFDFVPNNSIARAEQNIPVKASIDTGTGNGKRLTIHERLSSSSDHNEKSRRLDCTSNRNVIRDNLRETDTVPGKLMEDVGTSPINFELGPNSSLAIAKRNTPVKGSVDTGKGNRKRLTIHERISSSSDKNEICQRLDNFISNHIAMNADDSEDGGPSNHDLRGNEVVPSKSMEDVGTSPINFEFVPATADRDVPLKCSVDTGKGNRSSRTNRRLSSESDMSEKTRRLDSFISKLSARRSVKNSTPRPETQHKQMQTSTVALRTTTSPKNSAQSEKMYEKIERNMMRIHCPDEVDSSSNDDSYLLTHFVDKVPLFGSPPDVEAEFFSSSDDEIDLYNKIENREPWRFEPSSIVPSKRFSMKLNFIRSIENAPEEKQAESESSDIVTEVKRKRQDYTRESQRTAKAKFASKTYSRLLSSSSEHEEDKADEEMAPAKAHNINNTRESLKTTRARSGSRVYGRQISCSSADENDIVNEEMVHDQVQNANNTRESQRIKKGKSVSKTVSKQLPYSSEHEEDKADEEMAPAKAQILNNTRESQKRARSKSVTTTHRRQLSFSPEHEEDIVDEDVAHDQIQNVSNTRESPRMTKAKSVSETSSRQSSSSSEHEEDDEIAPAKNPIVIDTQKSPITTKATSPNKVHNANDNFSSDEHTLTEDVNKIIEQMNEDVATEDYSYQTPKRSELKTNQKSTSRHNESKQQHQSVDASAVAVIPIETEAEKQTPGTLNPSGSDSWIRKYRRKSSARQRKQMLPVDSKNGQQSADSGVEEDTNVQLVRSNGELENDAEQREDDASIVTSIVPFHISLQRLLPDVKEQSDDVDTSSRSVGRRSVNERTSEKKERDDVDSGSRSFGKRSVVIPNSPPEEPVFKVPKTNPRQLKKVRSTTIADRTGTAQEGHDVSQNSNTSSRTPSQKEKNEIEAQGEPDVSQNSRTNSRTKQKRRNKIEDVTPSSMQCPLDDSESGVRRSARTRRKPVPKYDIYESCSKLKVSTEKSRRGTSKNESDEDEWAPARSKSKKRDLKSSSKRSKSVKPTKQLDNQAMEESADNYLRVPGPNQTIASSLNHDTIQANTMDSINEGHARRFADPDEIIVEVPDIEPESEPRRSARKPSKTRAAKTREESPQKPKLSPSSEQKKHGSGLVKLQIDSSSSNGENADVDLPNVNETSPSRAFRTSPSEEFLHRTKGSRVTRSSRKTKGSVAKAVKKYSEDYEVAKVEGDLVNQDCIDFTMDHETVRLKYIETEPEYKLSRDNQMITDPLQTSNGSVSGYLKLPPGAIKSPHTTKKHSLWYFIIHGEGRVQVHNSISQAKTLSRFSVPLGVTYSIMNASNDEPLILGYVKMPAANS